MAEDTFSSIAAGYGGAQSALVRLGLLPGSFAPVDSGGSTAVQLPTPPPPIFTTQLSHTAPFPAQTPMLMGAAAPPPPQTLSPIGTNIRLSQPSAIAGAPHISAGVGYTGPTPPEPSYGGGGGGWHGYGNIGARPAWGMPHAPPVWTQAFTHPIQGPVNSPAGLSSGTFWGDLSATGALGNLMMPPAPTGMSVLQQRAAAARRTVGRVENLAMTGLEVAGFGSAVAGGLGAFGLGGGLLAGASAIGMPLMAASMWGDAYMREREGTRGVESVFSGMRLGNLVSPTGRGINARSAAQIYQGLDRAAVESFSFSTQDMMSTMALGQEAGLMRGHTGSTEQIVARVKELAKVSKTIMDLGEGLTQADAIELQSISRSLGISSTRFQQQDFGKKLTAAARAAGMTLQTYMSGFGGEAAGTYAQMGLNAGSGLAMGGSALASATAMVDGGLISDRRLSALGGMQGMATHLTRGAAHMQATQAGTMMLGALNADMTFDPMKFQEMAFGSYSAKDVQKRGRALIKGKGLTRRQQELRAAMFEEGAMDQFAEYQEDMTPETQQAMVFARARQMMEQAKRENRGMTGLQALTRVTGSRERAMSYMELAKNPGALRAARQQEDLIERDRLERSYQDAEDRFGIGGRAVRWFERKKSAARDVFGVRRAALATAGLEVSAEAKALGVSEDQYLLSSRGGPSKSILDEFRAGDFSGISPASVKKDYAVTEANIDQLEDMGFGHMGSDFTRFLKSDSVVAGENLAMFQRHAAHVDSAASVIRESSRFRTGSGRRAYLDRSAAEMAEASKLSKDVVAAAFSHYRENVGRAFDTYKEGGSSKGAKFLSSKLAEQGAKTSIYRVLQKEDIAAGRKPRTVREMEADPELQKKIAVLSTASQSQMGAEFQRLSAESEDNALAAGALSRQVGRFSGVNLSGARSEGELAKEVFGSITEVKLDSARSATGRAYAQDLSSAFLEETTFEHREHQKTLQLLAQEGTKAGITGKDMELLYQTGGDISELQALSDKGGEQSSAARRLISVLEGEGSSGLKAALRDARESTKKDTNTNWGAKTAEFQEKLKGLEKSRHLSAALGALHINDERVLTSSGFRSRKLKELAGEGGSNEDFLTKFLGSKEAAVQVMGAAGSEAGDMLTRIRSLAAGEEHFARKGNTTKEGRFAQAMELLEAGVLGSAVASVDPTRKRSTDAKSDAGTKEAGDQIELFNKALKENQSEALKLANKYQALNKETDALNLSIRELVGSVYALTDYVNAKIS